MLPVQLLPPSAPVLTVILTIMCHCSPRWKWMWTMHLPAPHRTTLMHVRGCVSSPLATAAVVVWLATGLVCYSLACLSILHSGILAGLDLADVLGLLLDGNVFGQVGTPAGLGPGRLVGGWFCFVQVEWLQLLCRTAAGDPASSNQLYMYVSFSKPHTPASRAHTGSNRNC